MNFGTNQVATNNLDVAKLPFPVRECGRQLDSCPASGNGDVFLANGNIQYEIDASLDQQSPLMDSVFCLLTTFRLLFR